MSVRFITHDVLQIDTDKPAGFRFSPGQAAEISINKEGWKEQKRPFSFTSVPKDCYLQFMVKTYPLLKGVTNELLNLKSKDELIVHDIFGSIGYKGEGYFIAGGAGITPFVSILRDLRAKKELGNNRLIFANKKRDDILIREEFKHMLGKNFVNILSEETNDEYPNGFITKNFLLSNVTDFTKYFYVCGPPHMVLAVKRILMEFKIDDEHLVIETA